MMPPRRERRTIGLPAFVQRTSPNVTPQARLVFGGSLLLEDEVEEFLAEVRCGTHVFGFDVDLVQVLEAEDVAVARLEQDRAEREPEFAWSRPGVLHGGVGEGQVDVDTIDALQAELA